MGFIYNHARIALHKKALAEPKQKTSQSESSDQCFLFFILFFPLSFPFKDYYPASRRVRRSKRILSASSMSSLAAGKTFYNSIVLDSGVIISKSVSSLLPPGASAGAKNDESTSLYTTPAVVNEIVDSASADYYSNLPYTVKVIAPANKYTKYVSSFARKTGDYHGLSATDIGVMALAVQIEDEIVGGIQHLRTEVVKQGEKAKKKRRRKKKKSSRNKGGAGEGQAAAAAQVEVEPSPSSPSSADAAEVGAALTNTLSTASDPPAAAPTASEDDAEAASETKEEKKAPWKGWGSNVKNVSDTGIAVASTSPAVAAVLSAASIANVGVDRGDHRQVDGQFSDASSSDEDDDEEEGSSRSSSSDDFSYDEDLDISDESCDVYVRDEDEISANEADHGNEGCAKVRFNIDEEAAPAGDVGFELGSDFPSLELSSRQPPPPSEKELPEEPDAEEKPSSSSSSSLSDPVSSDPLAPLTVTGDGRLYNSFGSYSSLVRKKGVKVAEEADKKAGPSAASSNPQPSHRPSDVISATSRIIGGASLLTSQSSKVDDDGEGWISSCADVDPFSLSSAPAGSLADEDEEVKSKAAKPADPGDAVVPPNNSRCACATTDFAMQNVLLQMGMSLCSTNGMSITRVKSWVTRCGACFTVYGGEAAGSRLFCGRCGSDALQRVAASTDSKTGKLKLHLSAKRRNNTRGTKFALPKPGKQNRFAGDLLLREDQMLTGAWGIKVRKGAKKVESMFGEDIIDNVGLGDLSKREDIQVGMGRNNPNQAKGGRERRGKSKKAIESKVCGMRRQW